MKRYSLIPNFSGAKFGARYGLDPLGGKFYVDGSGLLCVPDNLPDDPPIQEPCDPIVMPPTGIDIHQMAQTTHKIGNKIVSSGPSKCYHMAVDNQALLDHSYITTLQMEIGCAAFLRDINQTVYWNGSIWVLYDGKPLKP